MDKLLRAKDVAEVLQMDESSVNRLSNAGKLPFAVRLPGNRRSQWRYNEAKLREWIEGGGERPGAGAQVKRRFRSSTPVQRGIGGASQALDNKSGNGKAHGTEHPVNGGLDHA